MRGGGFKAWSYLVINQSNELAVSLDDMKEWMKISGSGSDALITSLIQGAMSTAELLTKRDLINKTYRTFRDSFSDFDMHYGSYAALIPTYYRHSDYNSIELRRSLFQSLDSFEYLVSGVFQNVDSSIYYNTLEKDFSSILLSDGKSWPTDVDKREQSVKIDFIAGYGTDESSIPEDIKTAIKMHVANAYQNRGDCISQMFLPATSRSIYELNRIKDIIV